jgi:hypothetical protein
MANDIVGHLEYFRQKGVIHPQFEAGVIQYGTGAPGSSTPTSCLVYQDTASGHAYFYSPNSGLGSDWTQITTP